jgi:peptidoglycan-N-acetylmuramic acid deacetylase PdaC-like protein
LRSIAFVTFARRLGFAGAIACAAALSPALAAEPKPDFSIKTKWVEASVILDAKIKADAALAANCLAEGEAWATKNRADADNERKQDPELFRNTWSFERKYETRSLVDGRYVSIVRADYEYTGGAHPNSSSDTILWDRSAGKRISIRPFFTETADNGPTLKAMRQGVIASLEAEKKKRGTEGTDTSAIEAIEPKLLKIGPVSLAPSTEEGKSSGLTFHYSPYAVGSYAEGGYIAFVPWETLKPYLTPEGARIFGGTRPKDDEDGPG